MVQQRRGFRADIEGLRALAVVLVVVFHAEWSVLPGGFIGVDVFFVLSGYLITGLLTRESDRTGRIDFGAFYARRMRRLLPAIAVVLLVVLAVSAAIIAPVDVVGIAKSARATAAYLSNFYFARIAADYFAESNATNPLLHMWSLSVEEQFYLAWPVLLLGVTRVAKTARRRSALLLVFATISLAAASWFTRRNAASAFYQPELRAWEFAAGGIASFLIVRSSAVRIAGGWVGFVGLLSVALLYSGAERFPGPAALAPVFATILVLLSAAPDGAHEKRNVSRWLSHPMAQWIGQRSYSWYLWHWPVLVWAAFFWPDASFALRLGAAGVALGLSALTFTVVEQPWRHHAWLSARASRTLWAGAAITAFLLIASEGVKRVEMGRASVLEQQFASARTDLFSDPSHPAGSCFAEADDDTPISCVYGDTTSAFTVVLFGDSHMQQWLPALAAPARDHRWKVVTFLKSACPVGDVPVRHWFAPYAAYPECDRWRARVLEALQQLRPAVVVVSQWNEHVHSTRQQPWESQTVNAWGDGLRRVAAQLGHLGAAVLLIADTPAGTRDPIDCLIHAAGPNLGAQSCALPRRSAVRQEVIDVEREAMAVVARHAVMDFSTVICRGDDCPVFVDGIVRYRDRNHLSATYVRQFTDTLRMTIESLRVDAAPSSGVRLRLPAGNDRK